MRDNFTHLRKRNIALRAGFRCSICGKATAGPADDPDSAVLDGDAAHITAASPNGPRYDAAMSSSKRKSSQNGIWACTQHARIIDSDTCRFSVTDLRSFKLRREHEARLEQESRAVYTVEPQTQNTARAVELPGVSNRYELFEIVKTQPYEYITTAALRDELSSSGQATRLLGFAAGIIADAWDSRENVVGILATLLSNNVEYWRPQRTVIGKLNANCMKEIRSGNWSRVPSVEPLAFALGAKGCRKTHRTFLRAVIENEHWRSSDADRILRYYSTHAGELVAIERHLKDNFRKDLLRANDVARLIHLLSSPTPDLDRPKTRGVVVRLLKKNARILQRCGEDGLVKHTLRPLQLDETRKKSG